MLKGLSLKNNFISFRMETYYVEKQDAQELERDIGPTFHYYRLARFAMYTFLILQEIKTRYRSCIKDEDKDEMVDTKGRN